MTSPYYVYIDDRGDGRRIDCETLAEAITKAKAVETRSGRCVSVNGDGAEGGYGDDGSGFWDGLTDDERETVEGAGL